jgi:hypothetical protein
MSRWYQALRLKLNDVIDWATVRTGRFEHDSPFFCHSPHHSIVLTTHPNPVMSSFPDYYDLLHVPTTASTDEIRQAYKKESLRFALA